MSQVWSAPTTDVRTVSTGFRELRWVDPVAATGLGGAIHGGLGTIALSLFGVILLSRPHSTPAWFWVTLLCMPVLYLLIGAIWGGLSALLYNLAALTVGGLELKVRSLR